MLHTWNSSKDRKRNMALSCLSISLFDNMFDAFIDTIQIINAARNEPATSYLFIKDPLVDALQLSAYCDHTFYADRTVGVDRMAITELQVRIFLDKISYDGPSVPSFLFVVTMRYV